MRNGRQSPDRLAESGGGAGRRAIGGARLGRLHRDRLRVTVVDLGFRSGNVLDRLLVDGEEVTSYSLQVARYRLRVASYAFTPRPDARSPPTSYNPARRTILPPLEVAGRRTSAL